jgi:hypothetical protein
MANMVLHVQVPEVMRIAVKCAKAYLKKADLRNVKIMRSASASSQESRKTPRSFLTEALRKIGALISNSDQQKKTLDSKVDPLSDIVDSDDKNPSSP